MPPSATCNELRLYYSADMRVITLEVKVYLARLTRHILNLNDEILIDGGRGLFTLRARLWNNFQEKQLY